MPKILLVTVGGSHQPIVTAIGELQPERVIFLCSDGSKGSKSQVIGEGTPCEVRRGTEVIERLPNIPKQVQLGDRFQPDRDVILIQEPDDLSECYLKASLYIQNIQRQSPDAQIMADYTGGTKSMSLGLAMAAVDYQVTLYVTTATRTNIIKVERGQLTEQASVAPVVAQRTIEQFVPVFLQQYNYPAAIAQLKRLLSSMVLPPDTRRKIQTLYAYCSGLDAWDRFEHREAWCFLEPQMKNPEIQKLALFLKRVINSRGQIDQDFDSSNGIQGHGYEVVQDLLRNAERRTAQERYDDAVGRLYRALELLAQIHLLKSYGIRTGDVNTQQLPEYLQEEYEKKRSPDRGKIELGLRESYELLRKLSDNTIGKLYQESGKKILNGLEVRNKSILAHGFKPITASDYQMVSGLFVNFIQSAIEAVIPPRLQLQPPQFPKNFEI
ncbi:TIGR02710 family CRISPR-associated CARF protein [Scytonema sp. PCC 10023]|uniref:TIGR02710 family CRISPR-associated CARF protein n=1 Tax=Scytonema sp. PCC 10023 TaxID=1680591 RepID=UPI0039C66DAD